MKKIRVEALPPASRRIHIYVPVSIFVIFYFIGFMTFATLLFYFCLALTGLYIWAAYAPRIYADEDGLILCWRFHWKRIRWSEISDATCFRTRGIYSDYSETGVVLQTQKHKLILLPASCVQVRRSSSGPGSSDQIYLWQEDLAHFINSGGRRPFERRLATVDSPVDLRKFDLRRGRTFWLSVRALGLLIAAASFWLLILSAVWNVSAPVTKADIVDHQPRVAGRAGKPGLDEHWEIAFVVGDQIRKAQLSELPSGMGVGDQISIKYAAIDPTLVQIQDLGFASDQDSWSDSAVGYSFLAVGVFLVFLSKLGEKFGGFAVKECRFSGFWSRHDHDPDE